MVSRVLSKLLGNAELPPLSEKEAVILGLLTGAKELYGLRIVAESNGEIGRGTVYVTLSRMADKGYVESRQEVQTAGATGLPRRLYRITAEGQRVLRAYERAAAALEKAVRT